MFAGSQRKVAQPRTPSRSQQDDQKSETRRQVSKPKPTLDLVIAASFHRIARIGRCIHEAALPLSLAPSKNATPDCFQEFNDLQLRALHEAFCDSQNVRYELR